MDTVVTERSGGIVTVTLNKPERRNALDLPMWRSMKDLFEEIASPAASSEDRVLLLTGAGGSFCAGADLRGGQEPSDGGSASALDFMRRTVNDFVLGLFHLPIPTIAAVEGAAAGAGANLAFACDLVVAGEGARFSQIFIRRALSVDSGGSWLLPRLIGLQKAKELAFFGDWISAADAREIGLVGRLVAEGQALASAREWAERLAQQPPTALRHSKRNLNAAFEVDLRESLDQEALSVSECSEAPEFKAAVRALFSKRE